MVDPWREQRPINGWVIAAIVWLAVGIFLLFWLTGDNTISVGSPEPQTTEVSDATTTTTAATTTTTEATTTTTEAPEPHGVNSDQLVPKAGTELIEAPNVDFFETDSSDLSSEADEPIQALQELLENDPSLSLHVRVYANSPSSEASNLRLAQERANSVVDRLAASGIDESRLSGAARGAGATLGEAVPANSDGRTEFVVEGLRT